MYVTRPLSLYRKNPSALSLHPPGDAPYTGIIVLKDEESEEQDTYCWGTCDHKNIKSFPFPQNKILSIYHAPPETVAGVSGSEVGISGGGGGAGGRIISTKVWFLPVLSQPLSSNLYYVIRAKGQYKGKACVSAEGTDICSCCFGTITNDLKPQPLDFRDPYQQFEIRRHHGGGFFAKSAAYDGVPPRFLRRKGWQIRVYRSVRADFEDALGISADDDGAGSVRAAMPPPRPGFEPPVNHRRRLSAAVLGRWYCPYAFVKEEAKTRRHMEKSMFYRVSLEQYWEEIFSKDNEESGNGVIRVNVSVEREQVLTYGVESVAVEGTEVKGLVWFRARDGGPKSAVKLGLSTAVVEGMKAVEVERGWCDAGDGERMDVRVEREEDVGREREWRRFGCYVLVESFCLRRMDGILIMKYSFRHIHKIRCKWE